MSDIKAVFFDLGDTLWHLPKLPPPDVIRGETMRRVGGLIRSWGHDMAVGDRRMIGRDIRYAIEKATREAFHGDCIEPDYGVICQSIAANHSIELTPEQGAELWGTWNLGGLFLGRELFPDVTSTLAELSRRGFRLGAITNRGYGGPHFREEVEAFGLDKAFETMAVSCDIGFLKPDRRIYEHAFREMGVTGEESVMVGDNLRADVEGAKALGMTAVWRRPTLDEPVESTEDEPEMTGPVQPDYTIRNISELLELPILRG
ncbi:MAG: HAD family hydrolase [Chloroflexota bacterium]